MLQRKAEMLSAMETSLKINYLPGVAEKMSSEDRLTCILFELTRHVSLLSQAVGKAIPLVDADAAKSGLILPARR